MSSNPEQIKSDIEATRAELSRDVDALAQTVRPANVAARQKEKVTSTIFGAKDRASSTVLGARDTVMGQASEAQSQTGQAISSAPEATRQRAQGNPLAAGLIAFGVGWLAGSILPASRAERQAAATLKEKAAPLVQEVTGKAKEAAHNLEEPAKDGFAQVRSAGVDAVQSVKDEASTTASDVAGTANHDADDAETVKASRGPS